MITIEERRIIESITPIICKQLKIQNAYGKGAVNAKLIKIWEKGEAIAIKWKKL